MLLFVALYSLSGPALLKAVLPQFLERLCVSIRAAKARAVLRRGYTDGFAPSSAHETAADALASDV